MSVHLLCSNFHYFFRIQIPVDLKQHFPSQVLKKSLKTADINIAKTIAVNLERKVQQTFTMIRTGMLSEEVILSMVAELYPSRQITPIERAEQIVSGMP